MPVTNIPIDRQQTYGMQLSNLMNLWQQVVTLHTALRSKMISCGYDDSSGADGSRFGLGTIAQAHAVFLQVDTVYADTLTSGNLSAINQMIQQVG